MHASICDMVLDLYQNSVEANASIIKLEWLEDEKSLTVKLTDNGKGMDKETVKKVIDPWFTDGIKHKHRKVGLGLPFLYQTVEQAGGDVSLESELGVGTTLVFSLDLSNIDCPPIGNPSSLWVSAFLFSGDFELELHRKGIANNGEIRSYDLSRSELIEILGNLEDVETLSLLKDFIQSQEDYIKE